MLNEIAGVNGNTRRRLFIRRLIELKRQAPTIGNSRRARVAIYGVFAPAIYLTTQRTPRGREIAGAPSQRLRRLYRTSADAHEGAGRAYPHRRWLDRLPASPRSISGALIRNRSSLKNRGPSPHPPVGGSCARALSPDAGDFRSRFFFAIGWRRRRLGDDPHSEMHLMRPASRARQNAPTRARHAAKPRPLTASDLTRKPDTFPTIPFLGRCFDGQRTPASRRLRWLNKSPAGRDASLNPCSVGGTPLGRARPGKAP